MFMLSRESFHLVSVLQSTADCLWFSLSVQLIALRIVCSFVACRPLVLFTDDILMICPGWESQLLETGFLAIFLCPLWTLSQVPLRCPPSLICIWTFRWLIVRIMLGAVSTLQNTYKGFVASVWSPKLESSATLTENDKK